ncbi:MAG: response regulator [Rhodospirillales bacterium]|nr:MAG: response regulator [Rhodospirillales bacterium]
MPEERSGNAETAAWKRQAMLVVASFAGAALVLAAALLAGSGAGLAWGAVACAVVLSGIGIHLLLRLAAALEQQAATRQSACAIVDNVSDALLLEDPQSDAELANGSLRALVGPVRDGEDDGSVPLRDAFESWLMSLAKVPPALLDTLRDGSGTSGQSVWIVAECGAGRAGGRHEVSLQPLGAAGRLWRVHRLGGDAVGRGANWPERAERHALSSAAGLYSLDGAGRITYLNPKMAEWIGRDQEDILEGGLSIRDVIDSDASDDPLRPGIGVLSIVGPDGGHRDFQTLTTVVDGTSGRQVHGTARPVGPAGSHAQRFQRLFNEVPVGVALVDPRLQISDCNTAFRELVADKEAPGKPFVGFVADSEKVAISGELQAILEGRSGAKSFEAEFQGNGKGVASIFAGHLEDDEGRIAGLVLLAIDVTEQKNLEAQLAQTQKMDAVGQLAGGIAHDFNNVLTAMIGFCDLLLQRQRPGDQSFADISMIKQNANRGAALVRQLLAFSRQQTLQPRLLNVTEVLAELSNLLRRLLGEKIELNMMHGRDLGLVKSDQAQLETAIINLAVNARDAMPGGGRLTIETGNVRTDRPRQAHGEMMPPGEYVQISVRDTGMGIAEENFARIFEPFFTTKEVGSGTGLGLATVYGIVKQTGGYLFVDSAGEGKGAVFDIYFKHQQVDMAAADSGVPDEIAADLTGGGTVLLVEDEDPVRLFSARALRNKGYKVIEAKTGEAALELLPGGEFDLLVTDMVMPRVDGSQVIREARKQMPDLPVICISGYTEESVLKEVESLDNLRFLSKPFSLKQLAGAVKESIGAGERGRAATGS